MNLFKKKPATPTFLTVEIDGKAYDYPKNLPIPRIGERISISKSNIATVKNVLYQVSEAHEEQFSMITITTER